MGVLQKKKQAVQQRPKGKEKKKSRKLMEENWNEDVGWDMIIWVGSTPRKPKSKRALRESKMRVKIDRNMFVNYLLPKPDRAAAQHCIIFLPKKCSFLLQSILSITAVSHRSFLHLLQLLHNLHWVVLQEVTSLPCPYYIILRRM